MSSRASQEYLLERKDLQNDPKYLPYSDDPIMPLEVEFRIYDTDKYGTIPSQVRVALSGNLSVQEATVQAFEKTSGRVPDKIDMSVKGRDSRVSKIVDKDVKIVHLFKEDDIFIFQMISSISAQVKMFPTSLLSLSSSSLYW
ncbi:hypothetical protein FOB63_001243 [Clavispora lusitaniae]|uniref:uncharacterized protein n=1 Tax=Clavispora lusitaniae TaxID=36911 RepID=UPI00202C258D|nr:hypothetical protein FOB63_001243 [Clavispora lusitaniae]